MFGIFPENVTFSVKERVENDKFIIKTKLIAFQTGAVDDAGHSLIFKSYNFPLRP